MADNPLMEKADDIVKAGGVLAKMYFDVHAKTEEGTKNLATGFIQGVSKAEGVAFAVSQIESTTQEEGMYLTYIMVVAAFEDVVSLYKFVAAYTPSSVEILKPDKVELTKHDMMDIALFCSEVLFDMKMKLYTHTLSPEEKLHIETVLKKHAEVGKKALEEGENGKD